MFPTIPIQSHFLSHNLMKVLSVYGYHEVRLYLFLSVGCIAF